MYSYSVEIVKLNSIIGDNWIFIEITRYYWGLLGIIVDYCRLLKNTGDNWKLIGIIVDNWGLLE